KATGNIIGTYRLRAFEVAGSADGFYSSAEFDLQCLPADVLQQSMELGRACIARTHRDHRVLFLLWRAVVLNAVRQRKLYLFGCCSLTSQEPPEGKQLFQQLKSGCYLHPTLFVPPKPGFECLLDAFDAEHTPPVKVPRLFGTYLGIGARVCSPPAI